MTKNAPHSPGAADPSPALTEEAPQAADARDLAAAYSSHLAEVFGAPIHVHTRAQLLDEGDLVDVTSTAVEAGFTTPLALTRAVWADCVAWSSADTARQTVQDEEGRLWDVLWMCSRAARSAQARSEFLFTLHRVPRGGTGRRPRLVQLKACIGPGDAGEPVVTVMLPHED